MESGSTIAEIVTPKEKITQEIKRIIFIIKIHTAN